MSGLIRFLRFEISGYVAIWYYFIYSAFLINFDHLKKFGFALDFNNIDILKLSAAGFILAGPIGFIMHEIDITIFSPFRKNRFGGMFGERKVLKYLEDLPRTLVYQDKKHTAIFELALSEQKKTSHIDMEITNRYSYYYARFESAIFAPIFGLIMFILSVLFFCKMHYFEFFKLISLDIYFFIVAGLTVIISGSLIIYCKELLQEIDDLEVLALKNYFRIHKYKY